MRSLALRTSLLALLAVAIGIAGSAMTPQSAVAGGGACHQAPAEVEGTGDLVEMVANCFAPTVVRIEPGTAVRFRNNDMTAHNLDGVAMAWGTRGKTMSEGESASFTFTQEGTFPYSCALHFGMTGVVVVGDGVTRGSVVRQADAGGVEQVSAHFGTDERTAPTAGSGATAAASAPKTGGSGSELAFAGLGGLIGAVAVGAGFGWRSLRRE